MDEVEPTEGAVAVAEPLSEEQIQAQMIEAVQKMDWSAVKKLAAELDKLEKAKAAKVKTELQAKLAELTGKAKKAFDAVAIKLRDSGEYDGGDGFWYAMDFGEHETACRIVKTQRKAAGEGGGAAGKSSYISDPRKSSDMLATVGGDVMFAEDTEVTIDRQPHIMPAGTSLNEAYNYSTNGGWRNRVRMAILKAMDKAEA